MTLTIACWKWRAPPGYRSQFTAEHVNILARMVARNYSRPHRFVCITDDADGIDPDIGIVPLWEEFGDIPSPHGRANPSCYRRLKAFSSEMRDILGPRFIWLDLDCVITGDLTPLFDRAEDFISWADTNPKNSVNGSMVMMNAGARREVYDRFDPMSSPALTLRLGHHGSDQAWISHCLGDKEAKWTSRDGVYSYRIHVRPPRGNWRLPPGARIVFMYGQHDPWGPECQRLDWVRANYQ